MAGTAAKARVTDSLMGQGGIDSLYEKVMNFKAEELARASPEEQEEAANAFAQFAETEQEILVGKGITEGVTFDFAAVMATWRLVAQRIGNERAVRITRVLMWFFARSGTNTSEDRLSRIQGGQAIKSACQIMGIRTGKVKIGRKDLSISRLADLFPLSFMDILDRQETPSAGVYVVIGDKKEFNQRFCTPHFAYFAAGEGILGLWVENWAGRHHEEINKEPTDPEKLKTWKKNEWRIQPVLAKMNSGRVSMRTKIAVSNDMRAWAISIKMPKASEVPVYEHKEEKEGKKKISVARP